MFRGEWFLDDAAGLPLFEQVLVKNPRAALLRALFRNEILDTPGVSDVPELALEHDRARRELDVSWRALTDLGELIGDTGVQG
jgi:hypothetical protein